MVVCPFVNSHAGQQKAAAGSGQAGSGAWWCMVVYGGLWWCVPLLIVTQGKERVGTFGRWNLDGKSITKRSDAAELNA